MVQDRENPRKPCTGAKTKAKEPEKPLEDSELNCCYRRHSMLREELRNINPVSSPPIASLVYDFKTLASS